MKELLKVFLLLLLAAGIVSAIFFYIDYRTTHPTIIKEPGGFLINEAKLNKMRDSISVIPTDTESIFLGLKIGDSLSKVQSKLSKYRKEYDKYNNTYEFEDSRLSGIEFLMRFEYYNDLLTGVSVFSFIDDYKADNSKEVFVELLSSKYGPFYKVRGGLMSNIKDDKYHWFKNSLHIEMGTREGLRDGNKCIYIDYTTPINYNDCKWINEDELGLIDAPSGSYMYSKKYYNEMVKPSIDSVNRNAAKDL